MQSTKRPVKSLLRITTQQEEAKWQQGDGQGGDNEGHELWTRMSTATSYKKKRSNLKLLLSRHCP